MVGGRDVVSVVAVGVHVVGGGVGVRIFLYSVPMIIRTEGFALSPYAQLTPVTEKLRPGLPHGAS